MMLDRGEKTSRAAKTNFTIAMALIAYIIVIPFITSSPIIHSKAYRNLLGDVKESNFAKDVSPVSVNDIRLVDEEMAMKLGDKKIGEVPAIGSVSKLGKFHIQNIDGELYWVAPLVHRDIIKWVTNMSGTSGYVMVSASNPQDVRLVQEVDGKPIKIVYQPDAYLHQDLRRHMYLKGYVNVGMTDFTLEIDDKGKPYWIVTLYENAVGYEGKNAIGIATVDTQSGEVKSYDIKDAPKWIDRIQPQEFVTEQINDWGTYINGFLNSVISEKGVLVATEGTSLVYGEDGKSYWYTGITSAGADDSTIGFMLVDTRSKKLNYINSQEQQKQLLWYLQQEKFKKRIMMLHSLLCTIY
ncbi:putative membrane protein [[Clostridium] sordellii ATCC 9714]|nr:putative membrane protein [[Clostridium] sordellii ATCC 9714] [Paeniclostridium sordellii ATCC 9714]